jgi:hypothetical protein
MTVIAVQLINDKDAPHATHYGPCGCGVLMLQDGSSRSASELVVERNNSPLCRMLCHRKYLDL